MAHVKPVGNPKTVATAQAACAKSGPLSTEALTPEQAKADEEELMDSPPPGSAVVQKCTKRTEQMVSEVAVYSVSDSEISDDDNVDDFDPSGVSTLTRKVSEASGKIEAGSRAIEETVRIIVRQQYRR
ncbi:unnamed protein product [Phytophthora fragariaefolia]|uniref:Unnamed protein product n=1 Tax=Phytophthora fragariaefolia TaxID=1490495 RepID=A0A9W7D716_9STRA|nr:unnamed protein product [Phytophthora fragariaefolia]